MRVLHLSTFHLSGGAGVAATRLNRALRKLGIESDLLADRSSQAEKYVHELSGTTFKRKISWMLFVLERLFFLIYEKNSAIRYAFSPAKFGNDLTDHPLVKNADVIHLHWINFGFISIKGLSKLLNLGKPVIWTFHDMWPMTGGCHHSGTCDHYQESCGNCKFVKNPGPTDLSNQVWMQKSKIYGHKRFTAVACSNWLQKRGMQSSLLNSIDVISIPNPIDTEVFSPQNKQQARLKLGLDPSKEYILFAAAKVKAAGKGYEFFREAIEAFSLNASPVSKATELIVFGQVNSDLSSDFPIKINFLGYLKKPEDIANAYSAASIFVTPSLEENLPNTIMEAMACGTPAVGFNVGGIPEMIDHKSNGYVADYKSTTSLTKGIEWVFENNINGELSSTARQKVLACYAESVVAPRYIDLYRQVLNNVVEN